MNALPFHRPLRSLAGSLLCSVLLGSIATAAPLWKLDLDAMTEDERMSSNSYVTGVVNTSPQTVGAGSVYIRDGFSAGSATLEGHSVVLSKSDGNATSETRFTMIGGTADYTATTDYELRFDLLLSESAASSTTVFNVRMINDNSSTSVGAIVFSSDGRLQVNSAFAETKTTENGAWNWGQKLTFKLQVDSVNKRFNVILNDVLVTHLVLDNTGATNPNLGIGRIWFGANSVNSRFADGIGIANIETFTTLSPIPEPSGAALLLLGGVAGAVAARRCHSGLNFKVTR